MTRTHLLRLPGRVAVFGVLLLAVSCSGRKSVYPVTGKVLFEGRPAVGARVQFHAENEAEHTLIPSGEVGADGTFRLTSYTSNDGAPTGRYAVTVFWGAASKGGDDYDRILVPERYLKPATSGLSAEVPDHEIELEPFRLTK
jgi:hypothetical protein